jgi:hypothetical protein
MSQQQRDDLDQLLRDGPLDLGGDVAEQRDIFEETMAAMPVPADVTTSPGRLGGIPVIDVDVADSDPERVIFFLHGGAYAIAPGPHRGLPPLLIQAGSPEILLGLAGESFSLCPTAPAAV